MRKLNNDLCAPNRPENANRKCMRSRRLRATTSKALRKYTAVQQLLECVGAVAHGMFLVRLHLREGLSHSSGNEDGIIAKAIIAARGERQSAVHLTNEGLHLFMGRGDR